MLTLIASIFFRSRCFQKVKGKTFTFILPLAAGEHFPCCTPLQTGILILLKDRIPAQILLERVAILGNSSWSSTDDEGVLVFTAIGSLYGPWPGGQGRRCSDTQKIIGSGLEKREPEKKYGH